MNTKTDFSSKPLTTKDLAERWQITLEAAQRRIRRIGLPGFNVGTEKDPDWRFRLASVELWEANNEQSLADAPSADVPLKPAMPVTWDGKDRLGRRKPATSPPSPKG